MKTLRYNGEQWYIDERSLWKRCRQWLIWIGGWEKPNGTGWQFHSSYDTSILMSPTPISLLGHLCTFFEWGWQMKIYKLLPLRTYRILTWSKSGLYVSHDGTPPRPEIYQGSALNEGFYITRRKRGG